MMVTRKALRSLLLLFLCLMFTLPPFSGALGETEETPLYKAHARVIFQLRSEPDTESRRFRKVDGNSDVSVLEYNEDWCRIVVDKEYVGYAKTEWLWRFHAIDPSIAPNLTMFEITGVATVDAPFTASVEKYSGNTFAVGDRFAISGVQGNAVSEDTHFAVSGMQGDAVLFPMMRATAVTAMENVSILPIAPYDKAQPGDVIAAFTTFYNEETGGKLAQGRAYNIVLVCERINGRLLESGEAFSFNDLCGPYKKKNGYQMAPNISNDGAGYGGGVCQVSTTLYNALLTLPIRITEWAIHRVSGVPYIPVGYDSAVGSYTDLRFINTLPYPIRIEAAPQNGVLSVFLYRATLSDHPSDGSNGSN